MGDRGGGKAHCRPVARLGALLVLAAIAGSLLYLRERGGHLLLFGHPEDALERIRGRTALFYGWTPGQARSVAWLGAMEAARQELGPHGLLVVGLRSGRDDDAFDGWLRAQGVHIPQIGDAGLTWQRHLGMGYASRRIVLVRPSGMRGRDREPTGAEADVLALLGYPEVRRAAAAHTLEGRLLYGDAPLPADVLSVATVRVRDAFRELPPDSPRIDRDPETGRPFVRYGPDLPTVAVDEGTGRYRAIGLRIGTYSVSVAAGDWKNNPANVYYGATEVGLAGGEPLGEPDVTVLQHIALLEPPGHRSETATASPLVLTAPVRFAWTPVRDADAYAWVVRAVVGQATEAASGRTTSPEAVVDLPPGRELNFFVEAWRGEHRLGRLYVTQGAGGQSWYTFRTAGEPSAARPPAEAPEPGVAPPPSQ